MTAQLELRRHVLLSQINLCPSHANNASGVPSALKKQTIVR
jgi:hypothetical protein